MTCVAPSLAIPGVVPLYAVLNGVVSNSPPTSVLRFTYVSKPVIDTVSVSSVPMNSAGMLSIAATDIPVSSHTSCTIRLNLSTPVYLSKTEIRCPVYYSAAANTSISVAVGIRINGSTVADSRIVNAVPMTFFSSNVQFIPVVLTSSVYIHIVGAENVAALNSSSLFLVFGADFYESSGSGFAVN
jgi:hypothetical protein